jgi:DHA1 family multidrug resistance protein-like MFS transporter
MATWQINLLVLWVMQFCASMGFALSTPFAPYFIQTLGVTDLDAVKLWATAAAAGAPLSMAIVSPLWGILADRYGRKPMLMRATFGAAVIVTAMAFSPNALTFVALRITQGMFSGVSAAAITLVACNTPDQRIGFALGCFSSSIFSGNMFGLFIGGFLADAYGYQNTFLISGVLLAAAGSLAAACVKENFQRAAPKAQDRNKPSLRERWHALGPGTLLLLLVIWMSIGRRLDGAILPIYVQELNGGLQGASRWSGTINAAGSFGAIITGLCGSMVFDRWRPQNLARIVALGAALFLAAIGLSTTLPALIPLRFALLFFAAAFDPIINTWIAQITPANRKGAMFGLDQTAKSIGMTIGPCLGGIIASAWATRAVFWVGAGHFLLFIPLTTIVARILRNSSRHR